MNALAMFRFALLCEAKYHDYEISDEEINSVVNNDEIVEARYGTVIIKLNSDDSISLSGWNSRELPAPWIKIGDGQYSLANNAISTMAAGAQRFLDAQFDGLFTLESGHVPGFIRTPFHIDICENAIFFTNPQGQMFEMFTRFTVEKHLNGYMKITGDGIHGLPRTNKTVHACLI